MHVVVVESPAKAKTINKYLGPEFTVVASYGHIRDLPPKDGSVRPDDDFAMDWTTDPRSESHIKDIVKAVKKADSLYLATDPDREGEAISWHVRDVLADRKALRDMPVRRVVFNEITRSAIHHAIENPRDLDDHLVEAYLARRALDYLVGFTLSPVLWRKLPGSRSAGRVQSVALRAICEREHEIEIFRPQEYWTVDTDLATPEGSAFTARLTHLDGRKLDKMDLKDEAAAQHAVAALEGQTLNVSQVERKETKRNPAAPFTTSTLQQEASRKLYMGAARTMQIAQRLYEGVDIGGETVGLITYMRTDGVTMANEAITAARTYIQKAHGESYLPDKPRVYKTKAKNAQEAHEAIRPTDVFRRPEDVAPYLDNDQRRLYELIWKRTVACQMASAVLDQVAVDITTGSGRATVRATGSVVKFPGFLAVYREDTDDGARPDDEDRRLPAMEEGTALALHAVRPEQHFTQPPPRYTEASLVRRLEELGIGRPSTYASILSVLQDREYVTLEKRRFQPQDRGRLVNAFLVSFFPRYVEYTFTADLENQLDEISAGREDWKQVLRIFWEDFHAAVDETKNLRISDVLDALDEDLGPHFFPSEEDRRCPSCGDGRLNLKLGRFGAFIGCSGYPECRYTRPLVQNENDDAGSDMDGPVDLGTDPETGLSVSLRKGPYGRYVQLGEAEVPPAEPESGEDGTAPKKGRRKPKAPKPKRTSLPQGVSPGDVDLKMALGLLSLPREIGPHPETGEMIAAGIGRFGPYLKMGTIYKSLRGDDDVLTIGLNRAVTLIAETGARTLGPHPDDNKPITLQKGRFGPYVRHGKTRANLPKDTVMDSVTLEEAVAALATKASRDATKETGKKAASKETTTKTSANKATAGKATAAARKTTTSKKTTGTTARKKTPGTTTRTKKADPS